MSHSSCSMIITRTVLCALLASFWFIGFLLVLSFYNQINLTPDSRAPHPRTNSPPFPGGNEDNIIWFIQLSDIHLSRYNDPLRQSHLRTFCSEYVDVIKPKLVLVTGDITDSKHKNKLGSNQFQDEWEMYYNTLKGTGVLDKTLWFDIRGNHDAFSVLSLDSPENYYRTYSVQGHHHNSSYSKVIQTKFGKYAFNAIDSCPNPGPRRPFNFFGMLTKNQLGDIENMFDVSNNMTIYFGHYPTSTISSPYPGIRHALRNGAAYLCGHLHTLLDYFPEMHTVHSGGNLELELGDWKDNRIFRVLAIDHDLLSFSDASFDQWPIVVITNPKNAEYVMPHHEPSLRMSKSTHVRILAFSTDSITEVEITIDKKVLGKAKHVNGPLYVLPWRPELYDSGVHELKVSVWDSTGRQRTIHQQFSLDNTPIPIGGFKRIVLMLDLITIFRISFFIVFAVSMVPLFLLRYLYQSVRVNSTDCQYLVRPVAAVLEWTKCVSQSDRYIFWSVLLNNCYVGVGPWFIGEVIQGHVGYVYVYGVYIHSGYIPGSLTFLYGVFQVVMINIPFTIYIGHCQRLVYHRQQFKKDFDSSVLQYLVNHWPFYLILAVQAYLAYTGFYMAYGSMAFFLSPMRTWSIVLFIVIRRWALQASSSLSKSS